MTARRSVPLAIALVAGAIPAAARASVAEVVHTEFADTVTYTAGDGEKNDLTLDLESDAFVLTDPGAEITPKSGCVPSGPHRVTCSGELSYFETPLSADLGDGDDTFTTTGPYFDVEGGPGHDVLDGGAAGGTLAGGGGDDVLTAGAHNVVLLGEAGDDQLTGGPDGDDLTGGPGADAIDGGGSFRDRVGYLDHTAPVTIDLSRPGSTAGAAGEGDTIANVEHANGGKGDDEITAAGDLPAPGSGSRIDGYEGDDVIHGGPGQDDLAGGAGDDWVMGGADYDLLYGGPGRDVLDGGSGGGYIFSQDGGPLIGDEHVPNQDVVICGEGGGEVAASAERGYPLDIIDQSCGSVHTDLQVLQQIAHGPATWPVTALRAGVYCHFPGCRVRIALRAHQRLAGLVERDVPERQAVTLMAPLERWARRELADRGVLMVRLSMLVKKNGFRWRARFSYYYVLHRP